MDKKKGPCNKKTKELLTENSVYKGFKIEVLESTRSNFLVWKDFSI